MLHYFVKFILKLLFRVKIQGQENYIVAGERVLLVINAGSLLDTLLISTFLPHRICVVVDTTISKKWWMRPVLACAHVIEVDFYLPTATLKVVRAIEKYQRCLVFHATRYNSDPFSMKLLEATALIAEKAKASILPIHIDGAAYSHFSYFRYKQRLRYFPKISLTILPPQFINFEENSSSKVRRKEISRKLYKIMTVLLVQSARVNMNIVQAFVDAVAIHGRKHIIAEDHERKTLDYGTMLLKFNVLGRVLARHLQGEERVGFMLPSSLAGAVSFFALHVAHKIPAMINFTAGIAPVLSACKTVELKTVISSRKFIKLGEFDYLEQAILQAGIRIIYLEDIADNIPRMDKIKALFATKFLKAPKTLADKPIVILFTSGTEGEPKAVFLSHRNALVNKEQMLVSVDIHSGDRFFNALPMFHTFGLGVGTLLPLTSGIKLFMYPSPLHYRIVPQLFYESLSTVICGTDTFYAGYARYGRPYDFGNARLVIAGAEKLRDSTAKIWKEKYNVDIMEGYGATETAPVISINNPANRRYGSVGRILPGMDYRLKPIENIKEGGTLCVKGDNVMLGYMRASAPGILEPPKEDFPDGEGWYDTGDIVEVDEDDFIYIKGRVKRFAKLGGEMISLVAVEIVLGHLWEATPLGIVTIPDDKRGEQLVLIVEKEDVTVSQIATYFASNGISALWIPKQIISVKQAPLLASGKFDYVLAKKMALEAFKK